MESNSLLEPVLDQKNRVELMLYKSVTGHKKPYSLLPDSRTLLLGKLLLGQAIHYVHS